MPETTGVGRVTELSVSANSIKHLCFFQLVLFWDRPGAGTHECQAGSGLAAHELGTSWAWRNKADPVPTVQVLWVCWGSAETTAALRH